MVDLRETNHESLAGCDRYSLKSMASKIMSQKSEVAGDGG